MNVSILLRLVTDALGQGRVAGRAEVVETGEVAVFKDQDEMIAFLQRASAQQPRPATSAEVDSEASA